MTVSRFVWLIFIGLICFAGIYRWQNVSEEPLIQTDGQGYYAYLPAVFIYHDLQFSFVDSVVGKYYPQDKHAHFIVDTGHGKTNKYFVGTSIVQAPFFLLAYALNAIIDGPTDGYSPVFQIGVGLAAITYVCLGLYFLGYLLLGLGFRPVATVFSLITILFGTNLFYYSVFEPGMSHVYTFFTVSGLLFFAWKTSADGKRINLLLAATFLGLTILIRPTNALVVLGLPVVTGGFFGLIALVERYRDKRLWLLGTLALFVSIVSIQPTLYFIQTGSPVVWSYQQEGFNFLHPKILEVLFSYRKGVFVYAPALIISVLGITAGLHRGIRGFGWLLLVLSVSIWVISSWWMWFYGGCYGHRATIDLYPYLTIGFAAGFQFGLGSFRPWFLRLLVVVLIPMQLVQTYQYVNNIILYDGMDSRKFWGVFMRTGLDLGWHYPVDDASIEYEPLDSILVFHDMESEQGWGNEDQLCEENAFEGQQSDCMKSQDQFGLTYGATAKELPFGTWDLIQIRSAVNADSWFSDIAWVVELKDSTENTYYWARHPLRTQFRWREDWTLTQSIFFTGTIANENDRIVIYPVKTDGSTVFIDNVEISFIRRK